MRKGKRNKFRHKVKRRRSVRRDVKFVLRKEGFVVKSKGELPFPGENVLREINGSLVFVSCSSDSRLINWIFVECPNPRKGIRRYMEEL